MTDTIESLRAQLDERTRERDEARASEYQAIEHAASIANESQRETEKLREIVEWVEGLKASANSICGHCKEPVAPQDIAAHLRECEHSPLPDEIRRRTIAEGEAAKWHRLFDESAETCAVIAAERDAANERAESAEQDANEAHRLLTRIDSGLTQTQAALAAERAAHEATRARLALATRFTLDDGWEISTVTGKTWTVARSWHSEDGGVTWEYLDADGALVVNRAVKMPTLDAAFTVLAALTPGAAHE